MYLSENSIQPKRKIENFLKTMIQKLVKQKQEKYEKWLLKKIGSQSVGLDIKKEKV